MKGAVIAMKGARGVLIILALVSACLALYFTGRYVSEITVIKMNSAESFIHRIALISQLIRLVLFSVVFTVGWRILRAFALSRSALDINRFRWKWIVFYYGAEAVIATNIYGSL